MGKLSLRSTRAGCCCPICTISCSSVPLATEPTRTAEKMSDQQEQHDTAQSAPPSLLRRRRAFCRQLFPSQRRRAIAIPHARSGRHLRSCTSSSLITVIEHPASHPLVCFHWPLPTHLCQLLLNLPAFLQPCHAERERSISVFSEIIRLPPDISPLLRSGLSVSLRMPENSVESDLSE